MGLQNTVENKENTTVIRWCAAYGLSEIAKHNTKAQKETHLKNEGDC
jgi:hypothetical protein